MPSRHRRNLKPARLSPQPKLNKAQQREHGVKNRRIEKRVDQQPRRHRYQRNPPIRLNTHESRKLPIARPPRNNLRPRQVPAPARRCGRRWVILVVSIVVMRRHFRTQTQERPSSPAHMRQTVVWRQIHDFLAGQTIPDFICIQKALAGIARVHFRPTFTGTRRVICLNRRSRNARPQRTPPSNAHRAHQSRKQHNHHPTPTRVTQQRKQRGSNKRFHAATHRRHRYA